MAGNRARGDAACSSGIWTGSFTGTFSADGNTISGGWEKRLDRDDGQHWRHDFELVYRRAG